MITILLDNGHGNDTPGKRSPIWPDGSQLLEWQFNRDIVTRAILRGTLCPALLTESLFMDNPDDCKILLSEQGRERIARWHAASIEKIWKGNAR